MSKICENCGKEVKDEYDFCVYCGQQFHKHIICPYCREEYQEIDYNYCGKCGGKLVSINFFESAKTKLVGLSGQEEICYNFWSALLKEAKKSESKFLNFRYNFLFDNYKFFAFEGINPAIARIHNRIYFEKDKIEIKIHIPNNKGLYDHLNKRKNYYNNEFGKELAWDKGNQVCFIKLAIDNLSINDMDDWEEMINEFINTNNKLCEVFSEDMRIYLGTIEKDKNYSYWSKVQEELSKTDFTCLHSYINDKYIDISYSDLDFYYGYLTFVKYVRRNPQVRSYIRGRPFYYLLDNKESIESELGFKLNWANEWFYVSNNISNDSENEIVKWQMETSLKLDEVIPKWIKEFLELFSV